MPAQQLRVRWDTLGVVVVVAVMLASHLVFLCVRWLGWEVL